MSKKFPNNPNLCLGYQPPFVDNRLPAMASHCLGNLFNPIVNLLMSYLDSD